MGKSVREKYFGSLNVFRVVILLLVFSYTKSWGQTTIFSENMGNPAGTTAIASNTFQNSAPIVFTGTGDVRATTTSSVYSGASGSGNVFLTTGGTKDFQIAGINTSACASMTLTFGVYKNTTASNGSELTVSTSTDGATYSNLTMPALPTGAGTAAWSLVTITVGIPSTTNLRIKFTNTSASTVQFRIDDVKLVGSCSGCAAPTVTITPTTQTICAGTATTISVSSSATVPSYTWQASSTPGGAYSNVTNGTPAGASYSGASTSVLTVTAGSTYYYQCIVADNGTCTTTSSTASLTVNTSPTITTQPTNKSVCVGSSTTFSIVSSSSPTYQWQVNDGLGGGYVNVSGGLYTGGTTAILTLTNTTASMNSYSYQCLASVASCGTVTSSPGILTVVSIPATPPVPTTSLTNPSCGSNTVVAMTSTVAGVTWYWEATAASVSTANSTSTQTVVASTSTVYAKAISSVGACASSASSLIVTIGTPVTLTGVAHTRNICLGSSTTFTSNGSGTASKYWQYSSDGGATYTVISTDGVHTGTNTATLNLNTPPVSLNGYLYQMVVNEPGCSLVTSATSTLYVSAIPATPPTPTAIANPACGTTSLVAMTSTVAGVTWYWQTTSGGTSTVNPTTGSYEVSSTSTVYVKANANGSSCFSASSSSIVVTIQTPISIVSPPAGVNQCAGTSASFSVTASGSSPSYQWQLDDHLGGGFVNINANPYTNFTTSVLTATSITAGMNGYDYRCVVSGLSPCTSATTSIASLSVSAGAPTIAASSPTVINVGCNGFNINWTNGNGTNHLVVMSTSPIAGSPVNGTSYTANSNFSTATATIAAGEKVVYNGVSNSVVVSGLNATTTYYYKIFEFNSCANNYLTSGTIPGGNQITTVCTDCIAFNAAVINACSGSCGGEGNNEFVVMNSGSYAIPTNSTNIQIVYSGGSPALQNFTESFAAQPSIITNLNSLASCGTLFVDVSAGGTIPPNSTFFIMNQGSCFNNGTFSSYCGAGTIYVAFSTDASWDPTGYFGNNTTSRYFQTNFSSISSCGVTTYSYNNSNEFNFGAAANGDGSSVVFNGTTASYVSGGGNCVPPAVILPIELLDFYATQNGDKNDLLWKVASEENVKNYIIEKSEDGVNWNSIAWVLPKGGAERSLSYNAEDLTPYQGITYYRLSTLENDLSTKQYKIISLDRSDKAWKPLLYQENNYLFVEFKNSVPKNSIVTLYDLSGQVLIEQVVSQQQTKINTEALAFGIYFVRISSPYKSENFKIIISK